MTWDDVEKLDELELEERLYPTVKSATLRVEPDCSWIHCERHKVGVTLELLHQEYLEKYPDGFRYTAFCERYRQWLGQRALVMRQPHIAGEKAFVDYSGKRPRVVNPATGEAVEVELFVGVLGASNYTFAEATWTQRGPDWIESHTRMLEYFEGAPALLVPDQLKSGVTTACRYEPTIQRTYEELATHYGTAVLPARPAHPRDKAKVEGAVLIAQRWLLARIRNEVFYSLSALNFRLRELLADMNARVMRRYGKSRRALFEQLDRPALRALPTARFEYADWSTARVNIDYHVMVDNHLYSVPFRLVHEVVDARLTVTVVELLYAGTRVAAHPRSAVKGGVTTQVAHMPSSHRASAEWTPSRILSWAVKTGVATHDLCKAILDDCPHPERGYRSCLGILRLGKQYGEARLEAACDRAFKVRARSYRHVASILKNGLDRVASSESRTVTVIHHENIRGRDDYH
jgi:transposase